jgi:hypothetical protein
MTRLLHRRRTEIAVCVVALLAARTSGAQTRYVDEVFSAAQTTSAVPYGSTTARCSGAVVVPQTHLLDVYEPQGDTVLQRPVVVLVPPGGSCPGSSGSPRRSVGTA